MTGFPQHACRTRPIVQLPRSSCLCSDLEYILYVYIYIYTITIINILGSGGWGWGRGVLLTIFSPPSSTNDDFHHKTALLDKRGLAMSLSRSPADHNNPISTPSHSALGDSNLACNPGSHRQWRQSLCLCGAKGSMDGPCP